MSMERMMPYAAAVTIDHRTVAGTTATVRLPGAPPHYTDVARPLAVEAEAARHRVTHHDIGKKRPTAAALKPRVVCRGVNMWAATALAAAFPPAVLPAVVVYDTVATFTLCVTRRCMDRSYGTTTAHHLNGGDGDCGFSSVVGVAALDHAVLLPQPQPRRRHLRHGKKSTAARKEVDTEALLQFAAAPHGLAAITQASTHHRPIPSNVPAVAVFAVTHFSLPGSPPSRPWSYTAAPRHGSVVHLPIAHTTNTGGPKNTTVGTSDTLSTDSIGESSEELVKTVNGGHQCRALPPMALEVPPLVSTFRGSLRTVDLSAARGVTAIAPRCFEGCTALVSIVFSSAVHAGGDIGRQWTKVIVTPAVEVGTETQQHGRHGGDNALSEGGEHVHVRTIRHESTVCGLKHIGARAFAGCTSLAAVGYGTLFPALKVIGDEAFLGCTALSSVSLPSPALRSIGAAAFAGCTALESTGRDMWPTVAHIGPRAFHRCVSLSPAVAMRIAARCETVAADAFEECGIARCDVGASWLMDAVPCPPHIPATSSLCCGAVAVLSSEFGRTVGG